MDALILFGHGARDPEWSRPLERVRELLQARHPARRVELAFLEFMAPDLPTCANTLVAAGSRHIGVLPMFIAQGGHLKRELPEIIQSLTQVHAQAHFELLPPIGISDLVLEAMAQQAATYFQ